MSKMQSDSSNTEKKNIDMNEVKISIKDLIFPIKINSNSNNSNNNDNNNNNSNTTNEPQNLEKFKKLIFKPENETKTNPFILEIFYLVNPNYIKMQLKRNCWEKSEDTGKDQINNQFGHELMEMASKIKYLKEGSSREGLSNVIECKIKLPENFNKVAKSMNERTYFIEEMSIVVKVFLELCESKGYIIKQCKLGSDPDLETGILTKYRKYKL
tara:strand:- start:885 stop:1523 length:639 start_codon:yes stop_codon:yes gene_type:complete